MTSVNLENDFYQVLSPWKRLPVPTLLLGEEGNAPGLPAFSECQGVIVRYFPSPRGRRGWGVRSKKDLLSF